MLGRGWTGDPALGLLSAEERTRLRSAWNAIHVFAPSPFFIINNKGLIMVPRRRNPRTTQTLRCGREPVLILHRVIVSGPITALAAASPVTIFGEVHARPFVVDARRVHKDVNGSVNPYALHQRIGV